ncbi:hypothetical protein LOK49_LG10G02739 [Camellia lanceoleosa]|uniref:Uncharacterized protein n=1 Tax=Camellia lanceoleosa TaxID=1840588 RepID=A0ACC0G5F8_9ERIC|nr:hypothetical protein LOK49_LG10G02739 [Camellia lanceoleosa]
MSPAIMQVHRPLEYSYQPKVGPPARLW